MSRPLRFFFFLKKKKTVKEDFPSLWKSFQSCEEIWPIFDSGVEDFPSLWESSGFQLGDISAQSPRTFRIRQSVVSPPGHLSQPMITLGIIFEELKSCCNERFTRLALHHTVQPDLPPLHIRHGGSSSEEQKSSPDKLLLGAPESSLPAG
jgi:hypothetical protein